MTKQFSALMVLLYAITKLRITSKTLSDVDHRVLTSSILKLAKLSIGLQAKKLESQLDQGPLTVDIFDGADGIEVTLKATGLDPVVLDPEPWVIAHQELTAKRVKSLETYALRISGNSITGASASARVLADFYKSASFIKRGLCPESVLLGNRFIFEYDSKGKLKTFDSKK